MCPLLPASLGAWAQSGFSWGTAALSWPSEALLKGTQGLGSRQQGTTLLCSLCCWNPVFLGQKRKLSKDDETLESSSLIFKMGNRLKEAWNLGKSW